MSEEYPEFIEPLSPYCLVRARAASVHADGPDDGSNPDWMPAVDQKVVFTPSISGQLLTYDAGTDDSIIVTVEPVEATTNADGWFVSKSGKRIYLLATDDPRLSATGWTWSVNISRRDIRFSAPSGGVVDLAQFVATPAVDAVERLTVARVAAEYVAQHHEELAGEPGPPNVLTKGTVTTGAPGSEADFSITGTAPEQVLNLTIPRGATGAVSTWEYYAAGRPDVDGTLDPAALAWRNAAPRGSTFYSTDGPQGAWVWRKRGASWVCVEGDTGWIAAASLRGADWVDASSGNRFVLARLGPRVFFECRTQLAADSPKLGTTRTGSIRLIDLPAGFRPGLYGTQGLATLGSVSNLASGAIWAPSVTYLSVSFMNIVTPWTAGDMVTGQASWLTTEPYPLSITI